MHQHEHYTKPVVGSTDPKDWYIYFEYCHNGKWHSLKKREGINRIKDLKERKKQAALLAEARLIWLQSGWNPILDPKFKLRSISTAQANKEMPFAKAMKFALEKKDLAEKSKQDYTSQLNQVIATAERMGIDSLPISQFTRLHVLEILNRLKADRKLSNHGYNKYRDTIRCMFSTLETWLAVEYNPATKIESLRTVESNKYASLDEEEKLAIREELFKNHFRFYVYIQVLYHTGIRPKEILALQIKDIDLKKQVITIIPDLEKENSKTKYVRTVPVNNQLMDYLHALELDKYPGEHYIFGNPVPGRGGRGRSQKETGRGSDFFSPSPNRINRDTVSKLWKEIVIDGLGINKHLYALKHTGADDKIVAGIDLDALRELYGHRSRYMTEIYAKKVKEVYARQIIERSPSFAGVDIY